MNRLAVAFCCSVALPCGLAVTGCGHPARPPVLAQAEQVRSTAGAQVAAKLAPEGYAHAEKLRADAEHAYAAGDSAAAQILSERAIVAYEHARVLGRVAEARARTLTAKTTLTETERKAAATEAEQKRVAAETEALETRLKVLQDQEAPAPIGPADPAREKARLASARALALDARLLCAAAQMLGPSVAGLTDAQKGVDEVARKLDDRARSAPLEPAMRARAGCLAALTAARRAKTGLSSLGRADELLARISAMGGFAPSRDERGVVITLRDVFDGDQLTAQANDRLATLAKVAVANPDFPLQVLVHGAVAPPSNDRELAHERTLAGSVAKAMVDGGVKSDRLQADVAGGAHPLVLENDSKNAARNARIEIVFVDPGG